MRALISFRVLPAATTLLIVPLAHAQSQLSLQDAISLANKNNGTIRAARLTAKASESGVAQAFSAFLPTLTPSYNYSSTRQEIAASGVTSAYTSDGSTTQLAANWRLLDVGQRSYSYSAAKQSLAAQRQATRQTLRQTLFTVCQQYYEALRAQELQRVADTQVGRAETILDQTKARVAVKDTAAKDVLQAQADLLNAKVSALQAKNQTATSAASLKALIGMTAAEPLPALVKLSSVPNEPDATRLADLINEGLENRPDLQASRRNIAASRYNLLGQKLNAGVTASLDATLTQQFSPDSIQNRTLTLLVSYPLFDGGYLRETARATAYQLEASKANLVQSEATARAEIESAFAEFTQNRERVDAAQSAIDASRENYNAALESQRLGASDVIAVLTAQLSLVTAESNYIQAVYDYVISDAKLKLVTGRKLMGE